MMLAGTTIDSSFENSFQGTNPPSAMLVTEPFSSELVDEVSAHPAVGQAEGRRLHQANITNAEGDTLTVELVAMGDFINNHVARIDPADGNWPPNPGSIAFERATVAEVGASVGETVSVERPGQTPLDLEVSGTAVDVFEVAPMLGGMSRAYVDMDTMVQLTATEDLNALYLRAAGQPESLDRTLGMVSAIRDDVLEPAGVAIEFNAVDEPGEHRADAAISFVTLAMQVLAVLALGVAVALVVNTVAALLAQQRKQVGMMKAIGANSRQLAVQYLAYVLTLSAAAIALSVPASLLTGRVVAGFLADLANINLDPIGIPVGVILLEVAIATVLPIVAVLLTIRRASRTTVREAITDLGLTGTAQVRTGTSRFARPTVLAFRNAAQNRLRLGLTVLTVSLCGAVLVGVISTGSGLGNLGDQVAGYSDYDIELALIDPAPAGNAEAILAADEEVAFVEGWLNKQALRIRPDGSEGTNIDLTGIRADSTAVSPTLLEGRWFDSDDPSGVVINADLADAEPDLDIGGSMVLDVGGRRQEWHVVGIATTTTVGPVAYMRVDDLAAASGEPELTNLLTVQLTAGAEPAAAAERLGSLARDAGLVVGQVQTHAEIRETVDSLFAIVVALLLLVGAILAVVAVIGVAGTMTLNVVEQTREIGVLRTLGATTWSVRRLLLLQGFALAGAGAVIGVALSVPVSLSLNAAIRNTLISSPMPLTFSWFGVGVWIAVAITIGALGATHPSRVASRLTIRDTLAYE